MIYHPLIINLLQASFSLESTTYFSNLVKKEGEILGQQKGN